MPKSINKVTLIGRLGRDPELKYTASGTAYCRFSMATDDSWTDKNTGERQERTEWHNIIAWDRLGEICGQYLAKGRMVYIEGSISSRQYEDKDGIKRTSFDIRARDMVLLGSPGGGADGGQRPAPAPAAAAKPVESGSAITDDDIPF
jgi:single-strand DNA-binding protein